MGAAVNVISVPFEAMVWLADAVPLPSAFTVTVCSTGAGGASCSNMAFISTLPSGMVNLSLAMVTPPLTTCHSLK